MSIKDIQSNDLRWDRIAKLEHKALRKYSEEYQEKLRENNIEFQIIEVVELEE